MNSLETVLTARLHDLADEMSPAVDPRRQVADARARFARKRRGRITFLAVATATAAVVVGSAVAVELISAGDDHRVAVTPDPAPTPTAPATTTPATPTADPGLPAGWEPRSFQGVTFAVPPGARSADTVDLTPATSWMDGPSLTWNGPSLGGDVYSYVKVRITGTYEGGLSPLDQGEYFTIPGAERAYGGIDTVDFQGQPTGTTTVWLHLLHGDRQIVVDAQFAAGPEGEQMAQDLFASLAVTPTGSGAPDPAPSPSTEWETRSFQGITFSVPPGTSAPDTVRERDFIWNGRDLGNGQVAFVSLSVLAPSEGGPWPPDDRYRAISVPGADQAFVWYGDPSQPEPEASLDILVGNRRVMFAVAVGDPQAMRTVVDSLVVS